MQSLHLFSLLRFGSMVSGLVVSRASVDVGVDQSDFSEDLREWLIVLGTCTKSQY